MSASSVGKSNDNDDSNAINVPWISMVTKVCDNVDNGTDSDIVDSSPSDWLDLQNYYNLDGNSIYDNDEHVVAFSYMTFTGPAWSDEINNEEVNQVPVEPVRPLDFFCGFQGQHDDHISGIQLFHHSLLKFSLRTKRDNANKAIEHFDAVKYKFC